MGIATEHVGYLITEYYLIVCWFQSRNVWLVMTIQRKRSYATAFKPEYSVEFPCIARGKEPSTLVIN